MVLWVLQGNGGAGRYYGYCRVMGVLGGTMGTAG